jgi:hypothetical protein
LLDSIGVSRDEIFITNAILCSPRNHRGANRRPHLQEIRVLTVRVFLLFSTFFLYDRIRVCDILRYV